MEQIAVIFWSGTGNTAAMATAVVEGTGGQGKLINVGNITADEAAGYDRLALGCPSMGDEVLEEDVFEPFFTALEPKLSGKKVVLFGSYDWGDGQWMREWAERVKKTGAQLCAEPLIVNLHPDANGLKSCRELGKAIAEA
jgi:flavodoxin short chain